MKAPEAARGLQQPGPRGRGLLLVVVAVVVSALAASATAVALGSRSDLSASRRRVDTAWESLRPGLDTRYRLLGDAAVTARMRLDSDRSVFADVAQAVSAWPGTTRAATDTQVAAAARLEGLVARLSVTVAATPRLRADPEVAGALTRLRQAEVAPGRAGYNLAVAGYNLAVAGYERVRGGFPRRLVAAALGYDTRRTLEIPA